MRYVVKVYLANGQVAIVNNATAEVTEANTLKVTEKDFRGRGVGLSVFAPGCWMFFTVNEEDSDGSVAPVQDHSPDDDDSAAQKVQCFEDDGECEYPHILPLFKPEEIPCVV